MNEVALYQLRDKGVFSYEHQAVLYCDMSDPRWLAWLDYFHGGGLVDPMPAPAAPALDEVIAAKIAEAYAYARQLRQRAVVPSSPAEMASWTLKKMEAAAYAQSQDPADAPMLSLEAGERGISLDDLAARVQANAAALSQLEAVIAGVSGRHKDTLQAMTDADAVNAYDVTAGYPPGVTQ